MFGKPHGNSTASYRTPSRPSDFVEGIIVALVLSAFGSLGYFCWPLLFGYAASSGSVIAIIVGIYALYLVKRSNAAIGRLFSTVAILATIIAVIGLSISLLTTLIVALFGIWLLRSCFFRSGFIDTFSDLLLTLSSATAALFAAHYTQSVFISFWTFFVLQAFHVYLPAMREKASHQREHELKFSRAFASAENAVRQYYAVAG